MHTSQGAHDCEGCEECKTTLAGHPDHHRELSPHKYIIRYNQHTGKPYQVCDRCSNIDRESYEAAKVKTDITLNLSSLTDEHFYKYLEEGKIYLQHNFKGADHFKDIKWFWNKDTSFLNSGEARKQEKANKTYKSVKDWIFYCGGRNSGLWHPKWLNE